MDVPYAPDLGRHRIDVDHPRQAFPGSICSSSEMHDLPQPPLGDAGNIPVDGHDALDVDRIRIIAHAEDFELRMIDDQLAR